MKRKEFTFKAFTLMLAFTFIGFLGFGQTVLSDGDIAIVAFSFTDPDELSFVCLKDITSGTAINFTDNGWLSTNEFRTGEGTHTWTAGQAYYEGDVVNFEATGLGLSANGDQIIAYQGTVATPTIIFALNSEGTGWQADATDANTSALPSGLTNAIAFNEVDNGYYNGSTSGTASDLLANICNTSNWSTNNDRTNHDPGVNGPSSFTISLVSDPSSFVAATNSNTQVDLSWNLNGNSNDVLIVYNTTGTFTDPTNGVSYTVGNSAMGGTVIYKSNGTSYNHTGLTISTKYYYKIWSVDGSNNYSIGVEDAVPTLPNTWINEFHYDNIGTDANEFVEIVIENAGAYNLSDFTVHLINGGTSASYDSKTVNLFTSGTTSNGYTFYAYAFSSLQNDVDGIALEYDGNLIQFISYEGSITGASGIISGVTSELIGVSQSNTTTVTGTSIQLLPSAKGGKSSYSDFVWTADEVATQGDLNSDGGDGNGSQVLPIELLSFIAQSVNNFTQVNWITATEINNDFFTVERSFDGITFMEVGQVAGAGNSAQEIDYSFVDMETFQTTVYYRLKQTDFDGASTYSNVVSLSNTNEDLTITALSISDQLMEIQLNQASKFLVELYDASGRMVYQEEMNKQDIQINTASLETGIYFLRLRNQDVVLNRKVFL